MPAFAIMDVEIFDIGEYMRYQQAVAPLLEAAGARYLARGGEFHVLEGDYRPNRLVLVEFPSMEVLLDFYSSPEYLSLRQARESCSSTGLTAVNGL